MNVLELSEVPFPPIIMSDRECFEDDLELAGSSVEALEEALGLEVGEVPPKAARAYLELLIKLKDERHTLGG